MTPCAQGAEIIEQKATRMNRRVANTPPRGWLSLFARAAGWLIVPLYVAAVYTSFVLQRRAGLPNEHPVDDGMLWVGFGAFALIGSLLVAKRPTNAVGWIMSTVALMVAIFQAGGTYAAYVMTTRDQPDVLTVVGAWVQTWYWWLVIVLAIIYLPLLFPDVRLPSRRWLPVAILPGIGTLSLVVLGAFKDTLVLDAGAEGVRYRIENPIG